jgi:hypothetical protein
MNNETEINKLLNKLGKPTLGYDRDFSSSSQFSELHADSYNISDNGWTAGFKNSAGAVLPITKLTLPSIPARMYDL